ncbi:MAG: DUF1858 domain-containing protein, partial [Angelakisella sp.]|nr:DUF1858 domain-containing protein [Angelakisella sp.]
MLITKEMGIMETVQKYPATVEVLQRFGMGCIGCAAAHFENIEQGALAHGIDVPALMEALTRAAEACSAKSRTPGGPQAAPSSARGRPSKIAAAACGSRPCG